MKFSSPLFLLGLLGMAIPLIIHFWKMRRAKTLRFGAIRFLLQSEQVTRRRRKFWEYLLLLCRMLLVAALSLALARPYRMVSVPAFSLGAGQKSIIIILDDSLSMQRGRPQTLFEEGKKAALSILDQLSDLDRAGLILPCQELEMEPAQDHNPLRKKLIDSQPSFLRANISLWLGRAEQTLNRFGAKTKKILVITDLQKSSFPDTITLNPFDGEIYFYDLGRSELEGNLSLGPVALSRESLAGEQSVKITAGVFNFSGESVEARLALDLGGQLTSRGALGLQKFAAGEKFFVLNLQPEMSAEGKIELLNQDALELDNQSYFHLRGGGRVKVLLVDGNFAAEPSARESYYLERALNPRLYALSRIDPEVISENSLSHAELKNFQVVVLVDCALLDQTQVERIRNFVDSGGGLFITLGEKANPEKYNRLLGDLLPREIRETKVPFAGAEAISELQPLHIDSSFIGSQDRHPILKPFMSADQADPGHAGFSKYFLLYQELVPKGRVILKLTDGSPLLLEKNFGKGNVLLFASSIGPAWNDLCIHPAFLPLVHQSMLYLARSLFDAGGESAAVGDQVELVLPAGKSSALVLTSRGTEMILQPEKQAGQNMLRISRLMEPGIYFFWYLPGPEPRTRENADFILAVNPEPRESDFRKISLPELKKLIPASAILVQGEKAETPGPGTETPTSFVKKPYHANFLLLMLALAGLELLILARSGWE